MGATVKILLDAVIEDEAESLHILERINNNDDLEVSLSGLSDKSYECQNLSVQEITTVDEDGVIVELYKPSVIKYEFIKVARRNIELGDIVLIDGIDYKVIPLDNNRVTLYSHRFKTFYCDSIQKHSVEEISSELQKNNVDYDIYKRI